LPKACIGGQMGSPLLSRVSTVERVTGIEPAWPAWKAWNRAIR